MTIVRLGDGRLWLHSPVPQKQVVPLVWRVDKGGIGATTTSLNATGTPQSSTPFVYLCKELHGNRGQTTSSAPDLAAKQL